MVTCLLAVGLGSFWGWFTVVTSRHDQHKHGGFPSGTLLKLKRIL